MLLMLMWRGEVYDGGVSTPDLFLSCLHEMSMAKCHTKTHELITDLYCRAAKKKKVICGGIRLHKACPQAIQASTQTHNVRKPQQQDC